MAMALNKEGNKGRTQVRRALMEQTGIRSYQISEAVRTIEAGAASLQSKYKIEAKGDETNYLDVRPQAAAQEVPGGIRWCRAAGCWSCRLRRGTLGAPSKARSAFPSSDVECSSAPAIDTMI
jgi:hypothetical protein